MRRAVRDTNTTPRHVGASPSRATTALDADALDADALDADAPDARDPEPDPDLTRVTRLAHTALRAPALLVLVTATNVRGLAATPSDTPLVPLRVARQLATAEGVQAVTDADGTTWFGTAVQRPARGIHVVLCTRTEADGGTARATLTDLAALAGDVLALDLARTETEAMRELLGTASHDLRNPLAVLQAGLETLAQHGSTLDPEQVARVATLTHRQAERMRVLIEGLLSLHGLETQATPDRSVDLDLVLRDVLESGRLVHRMVELRLRRDVPAGPLLVPGDADSLARLFTNLVTNAAVHGGSRVVVSVRVDRDDVVVGIEDDGPGMPADSALDGLAPTRRDGGHGLGLVIARRIIEEHGGGVTHRPADDGGTVVEVRLPRTAG